MKYNIIKAFVINELQDKKNNIPDNVTKVAKLQVQF